MNQVQFGTLSFRSSPAARCEKLQKEIKENSIYVTRFQSLWLHKRSQIIHCRTFKSIYMLRQTAPVVGDLRIAARKELRSGHRIGGRTELCSM